jgi:hypothetical protein
MDGGSWSGGALLKSLAGLHNGPAVPFGPDPNTTECFAQTFAKVRQLVFDSWRDHWKHGTRYKPIGFHLTHRLSQHFLTHSSDERAQTSESQPAMFR